MDGLKRLGFAQILVEFNRNQEILKRFNRLLAGKDRKRFIMLDEADHLLLFLRGNFAVGHGDQHRPGHAGVKEVFVLEFEDFSFELARFLFETV